MFSHASAFNQPLSFDTSSVTDMGYTFYPALAFNQPLSLDTSRVTDMGSMFTVLSARRPDPPAFKCPGPARRFRRRCSATRASRGPHLAPN